MKLINENKRSFTSNNLGEYKRTSDIQVNPPESITGSNVTDTSFDLMWTEPFSFHPIANYEIYQDGVLIFTEPYPATSKAITGLTVSTMYDYTMRTQDNQGNFSVISPPTSVTTSAGGSALTANFTVSPSQTGTAPFSITTDSFSTPSDGTIQFHNWDWGDGTNTNGGFANVPHTYSTSGTYIITLTVGDGSGNTNSTTRTVIVSAPSGNQPPNANATSNVNNGTVPLTVNFDGTSSSDSDGTIVSYSWTFGDGNTGTGSTPSHTYTAVGSYTAILTVTDDDGATANDSVTITVSSSGGGGGGSETVAGVLHRTYAPDIPQTSGNVTASTIVNYGPYEYTTKGFGNGYQSRHLVQMVTNPGNGVPSGKWLKTIRPGGLDAHTFGKAIRAINTEGNNYPNGFSEFWMKMEFFITTEWVEQNQGKPAYSWSNPNGVSPGSNPSNQIELLFHWFGAQTPKTSGLWPSYNPPAPGGGWSDQAMTMGIDIYANDPRITNSYSEPILMSKNGLSNMERAIFDVGDHCVFWVHYKLNTGSNSDGILRAWWSKDGGTTYNIGVDITDMRWTTINSQLQDVGFVQFYGGSGYGFEPGGGPNQNNGTTHPSVDYWLYFKELRTQSVNPLPGTFMI